MSRQQQDADALRSRPRANTNSFASFPWRRPRTEQPPSSQVTAPPIAQPLPLESLIEALTPPAVPSLGYARSLAGALSTQSPLPRCAALNPVLASLCDVDSPTSLQAAGFDVLSAYWENAEAVTLTTADRLSYLSLFLGSGVAWSTELWEPRFKAFRALTRWGRDIVGIESSFLRVLQSWIDGAFNGLLLNREMAADRAEKTERERSIDVLSGFLTSILENSETVARIPEEELASVLWFFSHLVDRSIVLPSSPPSQDRLPSPLAESHASTNAPPRTTGQTHRRNTSSASASSVPSVNTVPPPPVKIFGKHPGDIAITLYLNHLTSRLKTLSSACLHNILPLLFRALAFCATPLPRLTVMPSHSSKKLSTEDRITETLSSLFTGPYSSTCMMILKQHLFPPTDLPAHDADSSQNSKGKSSDCDTSTYPLQNSIKMATQTSLGAHRTLRNYVRRALCTRLARAYISREISLGYSPSGVPGHIDMERDLMERAWPKDDYASSAGLGMGGNGWDAARLGKILAGSVEAWVAWRSGLDGSVSVEGEKERKEKILQEAAGVLKDILQELDAREEDSGVLDEEEASVVGETLGRLASYVLLLKNPDGTPFIVPLTQPADAPTPYLRTLTSLLARDHATSLNPLLSTILISIADNLTDIDTARLPFIMAEQHDLSPTSPDWLDNWECLLSNSSLVSTRKPLTRRAVMETLESVYESVSDMKGYRKPLADKVWKHCGRWVAEDDGEQEDGDAVWRIIGNEAVLRTADLEEGDAEGENELTQYLDLLVAIALGSGGEEEDDNDTASVTTTDHSPSPHRAFSTSSTIVSPILSRMQSEYHGQSKEKDKESGLPSVISLLSSLATGNSSRSQSIQPPIADDVLDDSTSPQRPPRSTIPRVVAAVCALLGIFTQLSFTPFALEQKNLAVAIRIFGILLRILTEGKSTRARLTVLQFLMRLRADRDHRLYFSEVGYDADGHVWMLSSLINRVWDRSGPTVNDRIEEPSPDTASELRKARARMPQERDGRRVSRGRGVGGPSSATKSRSRSRVTPPVVQLIPSSKARGPLWYLPESLPFSITDVDLPSEALMSYDPDGPGRVLVLPVSAYLAAVLDVLEKERNWEILSYLLCHLPIQLSNKHLFCGPNSRELISKILSFLCTTIVNGDLASQVDHWPAGLKIRDAQGLAHHTLSVLVSYRRCFDLKQRHLLVEVFQAGLNGQFSTIKCCLHALSLSAFELQSSMTKYLPRIMEKLSQIMTNPNMAVHILGFLSIIASLPPLYANFTESDFKMVFGVALQYLQHYNRHDASPTKSWALSQHVRILSYYVVYVWFLAVRLPDRPRHIRYITRQLLLANEGNTQVDEPTEVCFDWLARYTYASADPRPTNSMLNEIVMNPSVQGFPETALSEKTWILGTSVVTIRTLARLGWIEVLSRRPSGFTKFLCRLENAPMVGPGDVNPDILSVPAGLMMERDPPRIVGDDPTPRKSPEEQEDIHNVFKIDKDGEHEPSRPNPITGYVWSGTAPSQRRKEVTVDPSFFALQLSSYPDFSNSTSVRMVTDSSLLPKFFTSLDRMPVIDTHKVGIMYVAPGQTNEFDILQNTHGSPAYTRFLEGIGRLINVRGQFDVYAGGLDPHEDGEYAYAWWDDTGQILYHTATMMPSNDHDPQFNNKKRHIGNDYVRIVWNDSGMPYRFDTLSTQFQFVNIVIEPHSLGAIAAFSNNLRENEYFKVTVQRAPGMTEFAPVGHFKLISAENLPLLVRQLSLLADWFASVFAHTHNDTVRVEMKTNWHTRLEAIRRFKNQMAAPDTFVHADGVMGQEAFRDFTTGF